MGHRSLVPEEVWLFQKFGGWSLDDGGIFNWWYDLNGVSDWGVRHIAYVGGRKIYCDCHSVIAQH